MTAQQAIDFAIGALAERLGAQWERLTEVPADQRDALRTSILDHQSAIVLLRTLHT